MTRRRVATLLLVIATLVAAVAGGTWAIFTDPVGSSHETFEAGIVDIDVDGSEDEFPLNLSMANMVPGDEKETTIHINNKGTVVVWVQIYVFVSPPWDAVPNLWECDNDMCSLQYEVTEDGNYELAVGATKDVGVRVWLPMCAGNACMQGQADLKILIVVKQFEHLKSGPGVYDCVALENKDDNWVPILNDDLEGEVCYKVGSPLDLIVNAYGLTGGAEYQLTLMGPGGCTSTDDGIAGPPYDPWTRGYWNGGGGLDNFCATPGEGTYNFGTGVHGTEWTNADGSLSYMAQLGLAAGNYQGVRFMIKESFDPWAAVLMETNVLDFTIP